MSTFNPDWDKMEALRESLREHMEIIRSDTALLRQALDTLNGWSNHGNWLWPETALEQAKRNTVDTIAALRERLGEAK
jgi:hypothetical protein